MKLRKSLLAYIYLSIYPSINVAHLFIIVASRVQKKVVKFIKGKQRKDGSWFGSWAICFTYAGLFALESLASVGETYANRLVIITFITFIHSVYALIQPVFIFTLMTSETVHKGCDFIISKQMEDGGWGESYKVNTTI
jgi:lanosterol synthase